MHRKLLFSIIHLFVRSHFDRTTFFIIVATLLIGWAKYKSERFQCLNGDCAYSEEGEFFTLAECHRKCFVNSQDSVPRVLNAKQ